MVEETRQLRSKQGDVDPPATNWLSRLWQRLKPLATIWVVITQVAPLITVVAALNTVHLSSLELEANRRNESARQFVEVFGKLSPTGDDPVKLGALYTIELLSREKPATYREPAMDIVTAYLRDAIPRTSSLDHDLPVDPNAVRQLPIAAEVAMKIVLRRDRSQDGAACLFLGATDLRNVSFKALEEQTGQTFDWPDQALVEHTCFDGADLRGASFGRTTLKNTRFSDASLTGTHFFMAKLTCVDFHAVQNMDGADFSEAELRYVDFSGVNLEQVTILSDQLVDAVIDASTILPPPLAGTIGTLSATEFEDACGNL